MGWARVFGETFLSPRLWEIPLLALLNIYPGGQGKAKGHRGGKKKGFKGGFEPRGGGPFQPFGKDLGNLFLPRGPGVFGMGGQPGLNGGPPKVGENGTRGFKAPKWGYPLDISQKFFAFCFLLGLPWETPVWGARAQKGGGAPLGKPGVPGSRPGQKKGRKRPLSPTSRGPPGPLGGGPGAPPREPGGPQKGVPQNSPPPGAPFNPRPKNPGLKRLAPPFWGKGWALWGLGKNPFGVDAKPPLWASPGERQMEGEIAPPGKRQNPLFPPGRREN